MGFMEFQKGQLQLEAPLSFGMLSLRVRTSTWLD